MTLTGRSAAKRAQRLSKTLKDRQRLRERIRLLNANRMALSSAIAATGQYGLPGVASSGVQGIRSSMAVQAQVAHKNTMWDADMASNIQGESERAKAAAAKFQAAIQLGSLAVGGVTEYFAGGKKLTAEVIKSAITAGQAAGMVASSITAHTQENPYKEVATPSVASSPSAIGNMGMTYQFPQEKTYQVQASPRNPSGNKDIGQSVFALIGAV